MRSFTWVDGKLESVGGHDDMAMACWICDAAIKMGAFSFSFGTEEVNKPSHVPVTTVEQPDGGGNGKDKPDKPREANLGFDSPQMPAVPGLGLPGLAGIL